MRAAVVMAAVLLAGCVPNAPYRTTIGICAAAGCQSGSIERHQVNSAPPSDYLLGVVEFDDQGETQDRAQLDRLFEVLKTESAAQDLCLVVFVHGWEHNASFDDPNMVDFRNLLQRLARTENQRPHAAWNRPRKVVGIYAGWRGKSLDLDYVSDLTFWNRMDAAERVSRGSIRELLGRARALHDTIDRTTWSGRLLPVGTPAPSGDAFRSTRLLTIGHSFGGLIVYTALAQYFTDRAAAAAMATSLHDTVDADRAIPSYGDLVVIVNPAVEAISWEPIRQIVEKRQAADFARDQPPVFVQVTSTADDATGAAFPLGRALDTWTENFRTAEERQEALAAVGHYEPFWTHDLTSTADAVTPLQAANRRASLAQATPEAASAAADVQAHQECLDHQAFEAQWRDDGYLRTGWTRTYASGAILTHRAGSLFDPNDPFWVVKADASVIASHSDISRPVFVDFVRQLYDDLLLGGDPCT